MGGIGFAEILFILVIAIIVYGKDLPAVARKVGAAYVKVRRYLSDVQDEIVRELPDEDLRDIADDIKRDLDDDDPELPPSTEEDDEPFDPAAEEKQNWVDPDDNGAPEEQKSTSDTPPKQQIPPIESEPEAADRETAG